MNHNEFYNLLENSLPQSSAMERKVWASTIIEQNIDIKFLSKLLWSDKKTSTRFLWLLSDVGSLNQKVLFNELSYLFQLSNKVTQINFKTSFATYWLICGIPAENESIAIELLFNWIQSANTNITTKSRSLFALYNLTEKYPELKDELKFCLENQKDKHSKDFRKRVNKILNTLET